MPNTVPCLWFDGRAEQAAAHYTAIFPNSEVLGVTRYGPGTPGPEGSVMTVDFSLDGQRFVGLNGGPHFPSAKPSRSRSSASTRTGPTTTGTG